MNHCYRLVWSDAAQRYVPAPETARGRGKSRAAKALAPAALLLGTLLASTAGAQVLPTGGAVISAPGSSSIHYADPLVPELMRIDQVHQKAILQWQSFNIANGHKVEFIQPNASAIALNRVVGGGGESQIHGQLSANGQVWLVNPNGVVFGRGSQVNVGALVASTLDISNEDFNAGKQVFTRGAAQGGITNQGNITVADGATLALLATTVVNEGTVSARLGNVVLAGGDKVTLQAGVDGRLQVAVDPATVRTLIENKHLITADGGQVVMTANAADALSASVVANTGTVQARTLENQQGRILLLADMRHGEVVHSGLLDASAPDGGNGGFIDTSAAMARIEAGAQVTTAAPQGKTGNWLIDPADLTISAGSTPRTTSGIGADTLTNSLATTSVTLQTLADGKEKGDIHVHAPVSWSRNTLTLNAHGGINVNAVMTASGTAGLEMNYGGYSATNPKASDGSGVHMALTDQGFGGRVDFTGVNQAGASTNALKINGASYTILNRLGSVGSTTGQDLQGIQGNLSGKYALGVDIDARATQGWSAGAGFTPIGTEGTPFTGTFEGLGHRISGLTVNRPEQSFVGLFGATLNATLRNVGLVDARVQGHEFVGALVGRNLADGGATARISHAYVTGQVAGEERVGGLVGKNGASNGATAGIDHAHSHAQVDGDYQIAGLVGYNEAGINGTVSIHQAYSTGQVTGRGDSVGGLVGSNIAGQNGHTSISHGHATGLVSGDMRVGGLVGASQAYDHSTLSIENSHASAAVNGRKFVGGLVGYSDIYGASTSRIANVHASGNVKGDYFVGGLVGHHSAGGANAIISHAYATGQVDGLAHLGGLIGANSSYSSGSASIEDAFATGAVTGTNNFVAGLVGKNGAAAGGAALISNSYATGRVSIVGQRGPFDGGEKGFEGQVDTGDNAVGGLVGLNEVDGSGTARITHSYATGQVSGRKIAGGLVGENQGLIEASFHATTNAAGGAINTGSAFNALGQGRTLAELTRLSTYAGWDIDDQGSTGRAWRIYDGLTTPLLRSYLRPVTVAVDGSGVADKTYDAKIASGPLQFTIGEAGATLDGQLGYASSDSKEGRYTTANATLRIGGLYSDQLGYDIQYDNIANLSLAIKAVVTPVPVVPPLVTARVVSPFEAGELTRNICGVEGFHGREFFAGTQQSDVAMPYGEVPRSEDIRCVQGRWSVAANGPKRAASDVPMLTRTADFIPLR